MKTITLTCIASVLLLYCKAQTCVGRYVDSVFQNIIVTTDTFSTANGVTLDMDIYQPAGDTLSARPVIVLAHGGSFIGGNKTSDVTVVSLCTNFAKRGYVTASISYRLSSPINMLDSVMALDELAKTISDAKAAVRYFRKNAATTNSLRIDTTRIFGGGNSTGAIIFMHVAYIDSLSECTQGLSDALQNNGGLEGNSGNNGYSSSVAAVIDLAGCVNNTGIITPGNPPVFLAQGDQDNVSPFSCAYYQNGLYPIRFCGLNDIFIQLGMVGVPYVMYTFQNDGHAPWQSDAAKFEKIDTSCANFLANYFTCESTPPPADTCTAYFYMTTDSTNTGVYYAHNSSTGNNLSYLWNFGDGDTSTLELPTHNYLTPGQYTLCLTISNAAGCFSTYCDSSFYVFKNEAGLMSKLIVVDGTTAIKAQEQDATITVYPNPASTHLYIKTDGQPIQQATIYNTLGAIVLYSNQPNQNMLDITRLPNGVYLTEITVNNKPVRLRWIKK